MVNRGEEDKVSGIQCPHCGGEDNIYVCKPCGREKYKCKDCNYLGNKKRFIKVE